MKLSFFSLFIAAGLSVMGCSKSDEVKPDETSKPAPETPDEDDDNDDIEIPTTAYGIGNLDFCLLYENKPVETVFAHQNERELSGIAASRINAGVLYMHGDSKNSAILISNAAGADLGRIVLDGQSTVDPEDIAVGPGPEEGKSYIYFADIGDNDEKRGHIAVYRFEEPLLDLTQVDAETEIRLTDEVTKLTMQYPDAKYNAETLLVDPLTKDIFILSKEGSRATVFKAAYPQAEDTRLEQVLNMRSFDLFTAGDISADGTEILLRNKGQVWYWERDPTKTVVEAFSEKPLRVPYAGNERQGEGIGFAADGKGFFTNSEVKDWPELESTLSFYGRK